MNNSKDKQKAFDYIKSAAIFLGLAFVYSLIVFLITGFEDHGANYWSSYIFTILSFVCMAVNTYLVSKSNIELRDWFLGYPMMKHGIIYLVLELITSIIFMAVDKTECPESVSIVIQLIMLIVHLIILVSCFSAKNKIETVVENTKAKTGFMKMLRVDAEMAAEKATDPEVKAAFTKLAENLKYSDPVSSEYIEDLEKQISGQISEGTVSSQMNDKAAALRCCERANLLLIERNKKCKALK